MMTELQKRGATNPMAATWTKAGKVRRLFKAGKPRQKDLTYDSERAILEARIVFVEIRKAMMQAEIRTVGEDVRAALVLMTPDNAKVDRVYLVPIPRGLEALSELSAKVAKHEKAEGVVPLGVAIWQKDSEADDSVDVWVQPWLVETPRAKQAAIAARKAYEESEGEETETLFS
jgi:hypothetical protein